jgi:hypothetical protein
MLCAGANLYGGADRCPRRPRQHMPRAEAAAPQAALPTWRGAAAVARNIGDASALGWQENRRWQRLDVGAWRSGLAPAVAARLAVVLALVAADDTTRGGDDVEEATTA